jgi:hypothetical protein
VASTGYFPLGYSLLQALTFLWLQLVISHWANSLLQALTFLWLQLVISHGATA